MSSHYAGTKGTLFKHNDDFSGTVKIFTIDGNSIEVPGTDILELIAYKFVLPKKISLMEGLDYKEILEGI